MEFFCNHYFLILRLFIIINSFPSLLLFIIISYGRSIFEKRLTSISENDDENENKEIQSNFKSNYYFAYDFLVAMLNGKDKSIDDEKGYDNLLRKLQTHSGEENYL